MKKVLKKGLCAVLVAALVVSLAGCAKISYVTDGAINAMGRIADGSWKDNAQENVSAEDNVIVIDTFTAGTYGGREFASEADVVNYYVECYNNTKAQTAKYIDEEGNTQEFYAFLGEEKLNVDKMLIDGNENAMLNNVVPGIVNSTFAYNTYGLPPSNNRDPLIDNDNMENGNPGAYDFRQCYFTPDDCLACNVVENADGTITIEMQPKDASMSARGADSQGRFFEVLKDLGSTVGYIFENYSALSWASGTTDENCIVDYKGGTGKVTIDPATNLVVGADYHMNVMVEVKHANITAIKDKNGAIYISHYIHYPASDEYLLESKGLKRA